jgi:hypothetical protein
MAKVKVAKGKSLPKKKLAQMRKLPGSSNTGKYKNVNPSDFIGREGGAAPYTYPANTIKRARAAKSYARNAPNPEGIIQAADKKIAQIKRKRRKK